MAAPENTPTTQDPPQDKWYTLNTSGNKKHLVGKDSRKVEVPDNVKSGQELDAWIAKQEAKIPQSVRDDISRMAQAPTTQAQATQADAQNHTQAQPQGQANPPNRSDSGKWSTETNAPSGRNTDFIRALYGGGQAQPPPWSTFSGSGGHRCQLQNGWYCYHVHRQDPPNGGAMAIGQYPGYQPNLGYYTLGSQSDGLSAQKCQLCNSWYCHHQHTGAPPTYNPWPALPYQAPSPILPLAPPTVNSQQLTFMKDQSTQTDPYAYYGQY